MTSDAFEDMPITDYLAQGGKLTSPDNPPPRYRAELLRLMSSFVDSELAGSAGFANAINWAPGIRERIAASRIVLEKAAHAEQALDLMSDFGTDKTRYNQVHDWASRVDRDSRINPQRHGNDMRLSVFHYPLEDWTDAVVMNVLMGQATVIQLDEMSQCSYTPLAEVLRNIKPTEQRHMELGREGLENIIASEQGRQRARTCLGYWLPRVAETFGPDQSDRFERLAHMGLRQQPNAQLKAIWQQQIDSQLQYLQLA